MNRLLFLHIRHAVKTGLAAAIAYGVSWLLGSDFGLWAVVTALIVMQGISVADSLQDSLFRFTGMSLGALVGMLVLVVSPASPPVITLEIFVICALGAYLGRYGAKFTLGTSAVCIVLLAGQTMAAGSVEASLVFGLTLAWEVLLGVVCGVGVSVFLWPVRLGDTLRQDISLQFSRCAELLDTVVKSYLDEQHHVPYSQFEGLEMLTWSNRERMTKVSRLEAYIYHHGHKGLAIQVETIARSVEGMRALIDVLNEYDEEAYDPMLGPELRALADIMVKALQHLGSAGAYAPAPEITRELTASVDRAEARLVVLRKESKFRDTPLHRILQLYTFYQVLRQLSEELLYALYELQLLGEKPLAKKETPTGQP